MYVRYALTLALAAACWWWPAGQAAVAQDEGPGAAEKPAEPGKDLATRSLPLRTALHHDPTLAAPLSRLLEMYRSAGAEQELLGVYRAHVRQYPGNVSGQTVLVRLLMATGSPETLSRARAAVGQFPRDGYLRYLLHQVLRGRRDPKALDALDKAIELATDPGRKTAWVDALLPLALAGGRRDLAEKHLVALAGLAPTPEGRLEVARKMIKHRFFEQALTLLEKEDGAAPSPETMVSLQLEAATAEVGLDRSEAAAARLDKLLAKLTADYWRRSQIVARRLALVKTQAERETMIAAARKRVADHPRDEAAVLDLAEMLAGFQLRRDALDALLAAGRQLPKSAEIERRTFDLFDRLRDEHGRQGYLAERIKAQPDRDDLVLMQVKTLYLLGRSGEARAELTGLLKEAAPADRAAALLAVARFLRRSALPDDAAGLFRQVAEADPLRLDVLRELAETYLVLGRRQEVRALFAGGVPEQADLEKLMDLVQFMIQQEFFIEARDALTQRVEQEKVNLEIRMLLLTVHRRLGNQASGRQLIDASRKLADTIARYRLWLESAVAFHEDFEASEAFLEAEQAKLDEDAGPWTDKRLQRRLIFAEVAARGGRRAEVAAMLREGLEGDLPPKARVQIRRQLISVLERDKMLPAAARQSNEAIRRQLEALAKDAPQYADECHARLALLHVAAQRPDLAMPLLQKIDVERIQDAALLSGLKTLYRQQIGDQKKVLAILHRLTVLNPTERSAWVEWVANLAAAGNESQLSGVLRRLLAGVDKMPLSEETRTLLQRHLADSHWRSIARLIAEGQDAALADALPLVDSVERIARDDQQWLWIAWTRAYLLARLGRTKARDEAIKELERVAVKLHDPEHSAGPRIAFPDGLSVSLEHARKLLTAPAPPPPPGPEPRQGPLPPLVAKWAFDTGLAPVAAVVPLGDKRTLICDRTGTGYCLDAANGRLLWQREDLVPPFMPRPQQNRHGYSPGGSPPQPHTKLLTDGKGRFCVPGISEVTCRAAEDGRLLWRADVGAVDRSKPVPGQPQMASPPVAVFLHQDKMLTYEPVSGTVTKIDPATGKIVWDRVFAGEKPMPLGAHNCGASLFGNRLLIYGSKTAILDVTTGEVEWSFEPYRVRQFPVKLPDPDVTPITTSSIPVASSRYGVPYPQPAHYGPGYGYAVPSMPAYRSYSRYGGPASPVQYVDYFQQREMFAPPPGGMRLTSAAVAWAGQASHGAPRHAVLADRWLLLFGSSGSHIIRTDLPLAGRQAGFSGAFVGMSGRMACLLAGGQLAMVDLTTGSAQQHHFTQLFLPQSVPPAVVLSPGGPWVNPPPVAIATAPSSLVPFQVALDGPMAYLTGKAGIVCLKLSTGQRAFTAPWPDGLVPAKPKTPQTAATPGPTTYLPSSTGMYVRGTTRSLPSFSFPSSGYVAAPSQLGSPGQIPPNIARAGRGVLYTLVSPTQVVALAERGADGR